MKVAAQMKMFQLHSSLNKNPIGVEIADAYGKPDPDNYSLCRSDPRIRGVKQFEVPKSLRFIHQKRLGRKPLDFENFGKHWFISQSCKEFFDEYCPDAMEFVESSLFFEDGSDERAVWLADAVKIIDAIDERNSDLAILPIGGKSYALGVSKKLIFFSDRIKNERLFRVKYSEETAICDKAFVDEFKRRKLKGASFVLTGRTDK